MLKSASTSLILLFARPNVGTVAIAPVCGLYSMIYGFSQITAGIQLRQVRQTLQPPSALRTAA